MKYPFVSFALSILLCFILLILIVVSIFKKPKIIVPATIEISSMMINEVSSLEENNFETVSESVEDKTSKTLKLPKQNKEKESREEKSPTQVNSENLDPDAKDKALITYGPLPKIPDHLRSEAFNSYAIAKFHINKDGSSTVELIKPCQNPQLNYLLLKNLRKWKFTTSNKNSVQEIQVNFRVE